jgi:hypothetical protein
MKRLLVLVIGALSLLPVIQANAMAAEVKVAGARSCSIWLTRTLKAIESSPMGRRRDMTVLATARACPAIPEALRAAAASYGRLPSAKLRAQALADGAAAVLKAPNCAVPDPLAPAKDLVTTCPLPGADRDAHPRVLGLMRAADYVFLKAWRTSLMAAGEFDETAHRLVLDFILSAAQLGESSNSATLHKPRSM